MKKLKEIFDNYKSISKVIEKPYEVGIERLEIGDIFVVYAEDLVYGVVIEELDGVYNAIFLTSELILGGPGYKVKVNHLVSALKVTPINFYVIPELVKYCEVIGKVQDLETLKENFRKLTEREYKGVWKSFYEWETKRIGIFYDAFLEYISTQEETKKALDKDELDKDEIIIDLRKFFDVDEIKKRITEVAAAASNILSKEDYILQSENGVLSLFFSDEFVGKNVEVKLFNKIIFSGPAPNVLKIDLHTDAPVSIISEKLEVVLTE
ncbi:hypothetical protein [Fervidobacterium nodosum]|uniref:Uncharacterized protein n=1 Tax=Fervidobacterium nodosum (strain ATCC 35602 / DSM 5306 / Rt17-B1) TaxID=381764 RepID=A7HMW3_FERNB|nr:hypothetical protein [Fervidobacterium nodosum]ABS61246.1 hypothetical protein Fnod_1400 [Fervidobacterium nodosum Rt17-B1]